ncbi:helix-turn-helix transcriptional regulator [Pseudonocardiaceae bacterium YIM PH 21723]|nr:helix-turn-helix transcriptional regulator [Pseudonocardiaceae bacterium YIM PH 21723]
MRGNRRVRNVTERPENSLIGRTRLLDEVAVALETARWVELYGPMGIGKTALLAAQAVQAHRGGRRVIRLAPQPGDRRLPYAGLVDLLAQLGPDRLELLSAPQATVAEAIMRRVPAPRPGWDELSVRSAIAELLVERHSRDATLIIVDDAQWLDDPTADVLGAVLRQLPGLRMITARRNSEPPHDPGPIRIAVPPLGVEDISTLLAGRGLRHRHSGRVHALSGGNPAIAIELGQALRQANAARPSHPLYPLELPEALRHRIGEWLAGISDEARETLLAAALCRAPSLTLLRRAGCLRADEHLRETGRAGLSYVDASGRIGFPAAAVPVVLRESTPWTTQARLHAALAEAADDEVDVVRHLGLSTATLDSRLADRLESATTLCRLRGLTALAAELGLLAAEHTPYSQAKIGLDRLVRAVTDAQTAGSLELTQHAAELVINRSPDPAQRVRARMALLDLAGQALQDFEDTFAKASAEAENNPLLLAEVNLMAANRYNLCEGNPQRARELAIAAAALATQGGDRVMEANALTMQARMERVLGDPGAALTVERARIVFGTGEPEDLAASPHFQAVRFDLFDDRLAAARGELVRMLAGAESGGALGNRLNAMRTLVEVYARGGECAKAVALATEAMDVCVTYGVSPGPMLYVQALAEAAGGSFENARDCALRGLAASEEEHDVVFTSRNAYALGVVQLHTGQVLEAATTLKRVAKLEAQQMVGDPSVLHWHSELATAMIGTGELAEAETLLEQTLDRAVALNRSVVVLEMRRAQAYLDAAYGRFEDSVESLVELADRFDERGLPIECGRTLMLLGNVRRRQRRKAGARSALLRAQSIFERTGAAPWITLVRTELTRLDASRTPSTQTAHTLTDTERRLAELVAGGMSNSEAAAALSVSVKTIEAMLTRIYRKLGLRSRAQLAASLREWPTPR